MLKFLTQVFKPVQAQVFGNINPPPGVDRYSGSGGQGLFTLLNNIMKLAIVGAGIFTLVQFIMAGYSYITSNGEPEKISNAGKKVWLSLIGLLISVGSFTLAAVVGKIIFGDANAIINPAIYGPQ